MHLKTFIILVILQLIELIDGHGRLMDPPARNSMWRFGFPNPVNYNDNELFCGGYSSEYDIVIAKLLLFFVLQLVSLIYSQ